MQAVEEGQDQAGHDGLKESGVSIGRVCKIADGSPRQLFAEAVATSNMRAGLLCAI